MDLPEPDSPTIASVVPRLTLKLTSSTALNMSLVRGSLNSRVRWLTSIIVSAVSSDCSLTLCSMIDEAS